MFRPVDGHKQFRRIEGKIEDLFCELLERVTLHKRQGDLKKIKSTRTISLACVVNPGEVFVAAALVGALGVVTYVRAYTKLLALILI